MSLLLLHTLSPSNYEIVDKERFKCIWSLNLPEGRDCVKSISDIVILTDVPFDKLRERWLSLSKPRSKIAEDLGILFTQSRRQEGNLPII
jgi:hypothetical protein